MSNLQISNTGNGIKRKAENDFTWMGEQLTAMTAEQSRRAEMNKINAYCKKSLPLDAVCYRVGGGNTKLAYAEGHTIIENLNTVFGPTGWNIEYKPSEVLTSNPKLLIKVIATLTVPSLGVVKMDVGYGEDTRGDYEKADKTAHTDALKRCARHFGAFFGLELYDKDRLKEIAEEKKNQK